MTQKFDAHSESSQTGSYEIEVTALHLKLVVSAQKIKVPKCHNLPCPYIKSYRRYCSD